MPADSPLAQFYTPPATVYSPRVLKDGADSVGALGALNRVYLNIGLFSEEWLLHFNPLIGGKDITPIEISVARENSVYWQSTEAQTPDMALFFLKSTDAHKLKDAPGGTSYLTTDEAVLKRGKEVFAPFFDQLLVALAANFAPDPDAEIEGLNPDALDYILDMPLPDVLDFQGDALPAPPGEIVAGLSQIQRSASERRSPRSSMSGSRLSAQSDTSARIR